MKECKRCETVKPLEAFPVDRRKPSGRAATCKACRNGAARPAPAAGAVKPCSKCGEVKQLEAFPPDRRNADGRQSRCRPCCASATSTWVGRNPDKKRIVRQRSQQAANRRYYAANREREKARSRAWQDANPEKWRAICRLAGKTRQARRRATTIVPIRTPDLMARMAYYGGCWMCGAPWSHIDHVKPLVAGGYHCLANLRPACATCNLRKSRTWHGPAWAHSLNYRLRPTLAAASS